MKMFHSYVESKEGEKKMPIWGQPIVFRKSSGFLKDSLRKKKGQADIKSCRSKLSSVRLWQGPSGVLFPEAVGLAMKLRSKSKWDLADVSGCYLFQLQLHRSAYIWIEPMKMEI